MEGLRPSSPDVTAEYQPMRSCDSDDSQSNASRSEDNEPIPGMIYTSDDSADVGQSDSTYVDSDVPNYIAENVRQKMEDELSQQLLLESDIVSCQQPSLQTDSPFVNHPLSPANINKSIAREQGQTKTALYADRSKTHLQVNPEGSALTRSTSTSSGSSSMEDGEFVSPPNFIACYEPLPMYTEDEAPYGGSLHFDALLEEDTVKGRVIHDHLNFLTNAKETRPELKPHGDRVYVGDVPIDTRYQNAFFVKWNWPRVHQMCVFLNLSILIALLCVCIGLIVHMPRGSDCDPVQEWWQGSTAYHLFVPSFQDSDGDGFGDLTGVINRLDYIQSLGVRTVRLAPIFESTSFVGPSWGLPPTNYTSIAPQLGDIKDLHLLSALLHERNMYLILDIPLAQKQTEPTQAVPSIDLVVGVSSVVSYWMNFGVDGFAFPDLDCIVDYPELVHALHQWRHRLDAKTRGLDRRIMAIPVTFLNKLEATSATKLTTVLRLVDLIDVYLDIAQSSEEIATAINDATRWDANPSLPWVNWHIGGPFLPRVAELNPGHSVPGEIPALGFTMLQLFLPGSVTLYYGDEIGLARQEDDFQKDLSWATPMAWSPSDGGFTSGFPWLSLGSNWAERNVRNLNSSLEPLRAMIHASHTKVPLYINGIFEDVGSFHPSKETNYKIRYATDDLLILDRFYPRRNKYAIVVNLGLETVQRDLSRLYYGGQVLASSHGKEGYVRFQNVVLRPREALALTLDK